MSSDHFGYAVRVRLAFTEDGDLYPTEAEAERAAKEQERARRLRAEAEVTRLEALLRSRNRRARKKP